MKATVERGNEVAAVKSATTPPGVILPIEAARYW
jgi:hypothetical protein